MPRNVRNFWIDLRVDGKATRVETGPVSKEGGFEARVLMRHNGSVVDAASLWGNCDADGNIHLHFRPERGASFKYDATDGQISIFTKR